MVPSQYPLSGPVSQYGGVANSLPLDNLAFAACPPFIVGLPPQPPTFIHNVKIWDGENGYLEGTSVIIDGGIISFSNQTKLENAETYDGKGGFLLPGLMDAHVHAWKKSHLEVLASYGVTTAFDMGSFPSSIMPQWRDVGNMSLTSLRFSGAAAVAGTAKPPFPFCLPDFPDSSYVTSNDTAHEYARTRISEGVDYLKIFIDGDGLPKQEYQEIIKKEAEAAGLQVMSHASDLKAQQIAIAVGGKFITHVPKDTALTTSDAATIHKQNQVVVPTLVMEKALTFLTPLKYRFSKQSVTNLYKAGVPILAGTDTNPYVQLPFLKVPFGKSLHDELVYLAEAGMSNVDVLKGATSLPAEHFGLSDRGHVKPGMRADLLLLKKDPLKNIANTQTIQQVWTAGVMVGCENCFSG